MRIQFTPEEYVLNNVVALLYSTERFIEFNALVAYATADAESTRATLAARGTTDFAERANAGAGALHVQSLRVESPMEIVLVGSSLGGLALLTYLRCVRGFERFQDARQRFHETRVSKAKADFEVTVYEQAREMLLRDAGEHKELEGETLRELAEQGALALAASRSIEIVSDDAQEEPEPQPEPER